MSQQLPPDQAQRDRAVDPSKSVLVRAPAGSGKTGVLLLRYLRCLLTVEQPEQVVAITFTNKAAGEIKERVMTALMAGPAGSSDNPFEQAINDAVAAVLARNVQRQWQLLENSARLRIATFDSFCGSITRRLPLLSGMGAASPLTDSDALYRNAILQLFRELDDPSCPEDLKGALERLLAYGSNRIESLLPLLSSLLAKRDQWLDDIVNGDAELMEEALQQEVLGIFHREIAVLKKRDISTLLSAFVESSGFNDHHAWAADVDVSMADPVQQFELMQQLAATMLSGKGELYKPGSVHYAKFIKGEPGTQIAKDWLSRRQDSDDYEPLSAAFVNLASLPPLTMPASSRQLVDDFRCALKYLVAYLRLEFERRGGVDFGEIAQRAIYALRPGELDVGEAILEEDRIAHILVDEMQDTSVSQIQLLKNLCQDWQEGDGRSVFFCGDLQQSIYAFRGSLVELFDELIQEGRFANRTLEQLQLTANFRSAAMLVNWVNHSFQQIFSNKGRSYTAAEPQRNIPGQLHIHPQRQGFNVKAKVQAGNAEADDIVELIKAYQAEDAQTGQERRIAILVRSRSHLARIIPALKQADIPFSGQDIDTLSQTPAVLDFTALLRALWHEADDVAWARLLRAPFVGLSWDDIRRLRMAGGLLRDALIHGELALSEAGEAARAKLVEIVLWIEAQPQSRDLRWALRSSWHLLGGPACVSDAEYRDVDRVLALLNEHAPAGILEDIHAFEAAIARLFATPPASNVELMTVHKSKGLEFDVVMLPGLGGRGRNEDSPLLVWRRLQGHMVFAPKPQAGDEPASRVYAFFDAQRRQALDEELDRQLYVALTRAKAQLHLFGLVSEDKAGELKPESSSFLGRLWDSVAPAYDDARCFTESDEENQLRVPMAPRLKALDMTLQSIFEPPALTLSPLQQAQRHSENAVLEDNIEQRAVGIVFHELMEKLGRNGERNYLFTDREQLRSRILLRLRHHCHPEPGLDNSADQLLQLLDNTQRCPSGQWILSSYQWQANEQTLRRLVGGQWQSLILDRIFIESSADGDKCWIIDYKTARAKGSVEAFFSNEADRYRSKMAIYRNALLATGVECPVSTALYFPAHQRLVVLD